MLAVVVTVVIFALVIALVVAVARDPGTGPEDTAVAYEHAWDRLDFDALWTLSGAELRDGLDKKGFLAAKRKAYEHGEQLGHLVERVGLDDVAQPGGRTGDEATVHTRLELRDGGAVHNEVRLSRREGRWVVVGYSFRRTPS